MSPKVPEKIKATHSTPGPTSFALTILRFMEKIKIRLGNISDLKELEILQIDMENTIEDEPYPDELGKEGLKFILQNPEQGFYIVAEYNSGSDRTTLEVIQSNSLLLNAQISLADSEKNYILSQFNLLKSIGLLNNDYLKIR